MSKISWTDQTWNVITGCSHAKTPGCDNCYARRMSKRLAGRAGYPPAPDNFKVTLHPDKLEQPLRWRKPRRVFVCSMGDLFHEDVPLDFIDAVFQTMALCSWHTFQVLTKRPERMLEYMQRKQIKNKIGVNPLAPFQNRALPNVWLGVTAENQQAANERRAAFEQVPAAVKFVSYEPALGPVDWSGWEFINWLIAGGETGPGARPAHPRWFRSARGWCQNNGVAFHFKQWGKWIMVGTESVDGSYWWPGADVEKINKYPHTWMNFSGEVGEKCSNRRGFCRVGSKRAGHLLDGVEWRQMPEVEK